jgi:hypothetical protein
MAKKAVKAQKPATKIKGSALTFRPLTPSLVGDVMRGSRGKGCWCMFPRLTDAQTRALPGSLNERRRGVAVEPIKAAVAYALEHGAPAVEAYPRASAKRTGDDNAFFGTEPLFRRAGCKLIHGALEDRPRNWLPRVIMRAMAKK